MCGLVMKLASSQEKTPKGPISPLANHVRTLSERPLTRNRPLWHPEFELGPEKVPFELCTTMDVYKDAHGVPQPHHPRQRPVCLKSVLAGSGLLGDACWLEAPGLGCSPLYTSHPNSHGHHSHLTSHFLSSGLHLLRRPLQTQPPTFPAPLKFMTFC